MTQVTEITTGSIVLYKEGHYRVTRKTKHTVNLGRVFGSGIIHKSVPLSDVKEDEQAWYEYWSKSDSYRCM